MAVPPRAGAARHADGPVGPSLPPGQHLLVSPVPAALAFRSRLHRPAHHPLASHRSLLAGGIPSRPRRDVQVGSAAPAATSSAVGASGAPDRTCQIPLAKSDRVPAAAYLRCCSPRHGPGSGRRRTLEQASRGEAIARERPAPDRAGEFANGILSFVIRPSSRTTAASRTGTGRCAASGRLPQPGGSAVAMMSCGPFCGPALVAESMSRRIAGG